MKRISWMVIAVLVMVVSAQAEDFYVDASRPNDSGDGKSWADAKQTIQAGIDATDGDDTVWVTNGIYDAGVSVAASESISNRVSFSGKYRIKLLAVSTNPADTVIVGAPDPDTSGPGPKAIRCIRQGSGHVGIEVAGFTITNGYSTAAGAGISAWGASAMTVSNCIIVDCHSNTRGGGVVAVTIYDSTIKGCSTTADGGGISGSEVYNCLISANTAGDNQSGAGAFQGNYWNCVFSNNITYANGTSASGGAISRCGTAYDSLFIGNTAKDGGALDHSGTFIRCTFRNNHATDDAGVAATQNGGSYTFINCLMEGNTAVDDGGVLYFREDGTETVVFENCTIVSNKANGIASALLGHYTAITNIFVTNSIVYANTYTSSGATNNYNDAVLMTYCLTTPLPAAGNNNITDEPIVVGGGDSSLA